VVFWIFFCQVVIFEKLRLKCLAFQNSLPGKKFQKTTLIFSTTLLICQIKDLVYDFKCFISLALGIDDMDAIKQQ
jgi:hypothetical protein